MAALLNIVVVEDHDELREAVVEILVGHGHHVIGLSCAEAFDDEIGRDPVNLLISDLNLPEEDGISLARRFRAAHPMAGIIMVTARTGSDDRIQGYDSGADIYLPKPVAPKELLAAVNALARRLQEPAAPAALDGAAVLQLDARQMRLFGALGQIELSDAEAAILTALARAVGQRLEVWQILDMLGQEIDAASKASLEVRFVRLRKKLIAVGAEKICIRALRLRGYQLCVPIRVY